MKKTIKVFEAGNYPQGAFQFQRVNDIFGAVNAPISAIFSHTSHWGNNNPTEVGEFSNFNMKGNAVYADIEFNEKGESYYNDGILKGVSVEIDNNTDKLLRIAVLPVGINPAVATAEFQEETSIIIEFEEVKLTLAEILAALAGLSAQDRVTLTIAALEGLDVTQVDVQPILTKAWELDDQQWYANKLVGEGYTVVKTAEFSKQQLIDLAKPLNLNVIEFENKAIKTQEELRAEIKEEIEFENKIVAVMGEVKKKFPPVMQGIVEFALKKAGDERDTIIEFSETEKICMFEKINTTINSIPDSPLFKNYFENLEFEDNKKGNIDNSYEAGAKAAKS